MLTDGEMNRIASLWVPDCWPDFTDKAFAADGHRSPFNYHLERVRHLGLSGGRLIEAGCGTGRWCFAFASCFDHVVGFDITPARVATAIWLKERFGLDNVGFLKGDVRQVPADDQSVDVVYSNSLALGEVDLGVILRECFRVLRPRGVCYIGLNGPGYAYYLAGHPDPTRAARGPKRIYNDLCQPRLSRLAPLISPGGNLHRKARAGLKLRLSPEALLTNIGATESQVDAARTIAADLRPEFTETLASDLESICAGRQTGFSHAKAGRGYDPEELHATALEAGFARFEWAFDGYLSLQPDGVILKGPAPLAKPSPGEFEGRIRVYEALMWKP